MKMHVVFQNADNGFRREHSFQGENDFYDQFCADLSEAVQKAAPLNLENIHKLFLEVISQPIPDGGNDYTESEITFYNPDALITITPNYFYTTMGVFCDMVPISRLLCSD